MTLCEDCKTVAATSGCKKCWDCRDFQLRLNSATRRHGARQCALCGESISGWRWVWLCDDCRSRGAVIEFDMVKVQ